MHAGLRNPDRQAFVHAGGIGRNGGKNFRRQLARAEINDLGPQLIGDQLELLLCVDIAEVRKYLAEALPAAVVLLLDLFQLEIVQHALGPDEIQEGAGSGIAVAFAHWAISA